MNKQNNPLYILNSKTNRYVLRSGHVGKMLTDPHSHSKITAGKGTMSHRRQLLEFLNERKAGHQDDPFSDDDDLVVPVTVVADEAPKRIRLYDDMDDWGSVRFSAPPTERYLHKLVTRLHPHKNTLASQINQKKAEAQSYDPLAHVLSYGQYDDERSESDSEEDDYVLPDMQQISDISSILQAARHLGKPRWSENMFSDDEE